MLILFLFVYYFRINHTIALMKVTKRTAFALQAHSFARMVNALSQSTLATVCQTAEMAAMKRTVHHQHVMSLDATMVVASRRPGFAMAIQIAVMETARTRLLATRPKFAQIQLESSVAA